MPLKLVKPAEKPKHDRAVCPVHGVITHAIEVIGCPEINKKTGKWKRQGAMRILICKQCDREGVHTEVAR